MNYRRLGRTGLRVSEISLGTVELGLDYGVPVHGEHLRPSEERASHLLNRALDLGINFIDTARVYGTSEEVIGRALQSRQHEYILATKVALPNGGGLPSKELQRRVKESIVTSLRALQIEVIDLLQIHSAPVEVILRGEVIEAIQDAQRAGRVRFTGASVYSEAAALAALEDGRYDCLQIAYNLLDRQPEDKVLPLAQQKDVGIIVRSVLLRGVLTHRYTLIPQSLGELRSAVEQLNGLVGSEVASLPELAYRFVLAHPAVTTALIGTSRIDELEAGLAYADRGPLSPALLARIRAITVCDRNQLHPGTWPSQEEAWQGDRASR